MTSTTESLIDKQMPKKEKVTKVVEAVRETVKAADAKAPSCDHAAERERIGSGYLVCPVCSEEIAN